MKIRLNRIAAGYARRNIDSVARRVNGKSGDSLIVKGQRRQKLIKSRAGGSAVNRVYLRRTAQKINELRRLINPRKKDGTLIVQIRRANDFD